jgi:histidinol dehydrogenase
MIKESHGKQKTNQKIIYLMIKMTKIDIARPVPSVINLSKYKNLYGHANSIKTRMKKR